MAQPTEAHWQEAERQHDAFDGIADHDWFDRQEPWARAMAQLVADGAVSTPGYKPEDHEIDDAVAYSNKFFTDGRSYNFAVAEYDRRFWCIASMMRSLGQATADPLSDGERKELAELRAFKARVMEAVK